MMTGLYLNNHVSKACKLSYLNSEDSLSHDEDWYSSCVYDDMKLEVSSNGTPALFQQSAAEEWLSYFTLIPYKYYDLLSEWMLDYRGLIPAELAIDVNTLPKNPYEK